MHKNEIDALTNKHNAAMTEMAQRIKTLEDTNVLKAIHDLNSVDNDVQSDVVITVEE